MDLLASKTAINKYMSSRALEFTSANSWWQAGLIMF
jgi:hypothetical protein